MKNVIYICCSIIFLLSFIEIKSMNKQSKSQVKEKPEAIESELPCNLYKPIEAYCKYAVIIEGKRIAYTTKIQMTFDGTRIKKNKRGGLEIKWQEIFNLIRIFGIPHNEDQAYLAQVDITDATKRLKQHFRPQMESSFENKIRTGKVQLTGLYLHNYPPEPPQSFFYKSLCGLALISTGWIGKSLWDAGGKKYTMLWGNYLFQQFINHLKDLSLDHIFLQKS